MGQEGQVYNGASEKALFIKVADNLQLSNIEKSCKDTLYHLFLIRAFKSCSMIHLEDVLYQS